MAHAYCSLRKGCAGLAAATAAATSLLCACASSGSSSGAKPPAPAQPAPAAPGRDWHALVRVPFGTLLKDVPFRLGEIVVFHDSTGGSGREDRDCHMLEGTPPPTWFGRPVDEYSLCFSSDKLNRIEASVSLPAESASAQFAAACAEWQRHGTPGVSAPDRCGVRDGSTEIDARLKASETADGGAGEPALSISLVDSGTPGDAGT
jgi:hypothetical protein